MSPRVWPGLGGSGVIVAIGLVGEQDALAEQVGFGAAVHPPRHHAAPGAGRLAGASPGQHMHRPARRGHALDGHLGQVRNKDDESLKIARRP